jgi:hypothetical protein
MLGNSLFIGSSSEYLNSSGALSLSYAPEFYALNGYMLSSMHMSLKSTDYDAKSRLHV